MNAPKSGKNYQVFVAVTETGLSAKFADGAGIGLSRENVTYYETIGRWFCREVGAGRITGPGEIEEYP